MIQIGSQPPLAILADGPPSEPDEEIRGHSGPDGFLDFSPSRDSGDGRVFVSPPPMPFPRVFSGL